MADPTRHFEQRNLSSTNNVVDFFRSGKPTNSDSGGLTLSDIMGNPVFEKYLESIMESIVIDAIYRKMQESNSLDDPFDSVLIMNLEPDVISQKAVSDLTMLSRAVEDRTSEVTFDDDDD